jgi:hypothetical protein
VAGWIKASFISPIQGLVSPKRFHLQRTPNTTVVTPEERTRLATTDCLYTNDESGRHCESKRRLRVSSRRGMLWKTSSHLCSLTRVSSSSSLRNSPVRHDSCSREQARAHSYLPEARKPHPNYLQALPRFACVRALPSMRPRHVVLTPLPLQSILTTLLLSTSSGQTYLVQQHGHTSAHNGHCCGKRGKFCELFLLR